MSRVQQSFISTIERCNVLAHFKNFQCCDKDVSDTNNASYLLSYPCYVNYFKKKNELNSDDVLIGVGFAFCWMPTTWKNKAEYSSNQQVSKETVEFINWVINVSPTTHELRTDCGLDIKKLNAIKPFFNNSIVGLSKLMHFVNPEVFPIFDSHVYRFLRLVAGKGPVKAIDNSALNQQAAYCDYVKLVHQVIAEDDFKKNIDLYKNMIKVDGQTLFPITPVRVCEQLMYLIGKNHNNLPVEGCAQNG